MRKGWWTAGLVVLALGRAGLGETIDLADPGSRGMWLAHPAIGDVSFDAFVRAKSNPIYTGSPPYEWPVNGFLFRDSPSGDLYCFVSMYPRGYWPAGPERLLRSRDQGQSWEDLGIVLKGDKDAFDGDGQKAGASADAVLAQGDDGYHLIYDWTTPNNSDGGIAYAFAKSPAGPYVRDPQPIRAESKQAILPPNYKRTYAPTLVRRKHDWLILASMSTPGNAGGMWQMVAMTAAQARGPYGETIVLRRPQDGTYFPHPNEFCPAFTHEEYVYANLSSVAANRSYQLILRAKIEEAHKPEAWSVYQEGSLFHAEPIASEMTGIWGQSFSAVVDNGRMLVMYPARDSQDRGTINLASRPWDQPMQHGFWLSGSNAPALGLVLREFETFKLEIEATAQRSWRLVWNHRGPLGSNHLGSDMFAHELTLADMTALSISDAAWKLDVVRPDGTATTRGQGALTGGPGKRRLEVHQDAARVEIMLDGKALVQADLPATGGGLGLIADKGTCLNVHRFTIDSAGRPRWFALLGMEGLLQAGEAEAAWTKRTAGFRFGTGYTSAAEGARAKWNFVGRGVKLWSPRGPEWGTANVVLDGKAVADISLHADAEKASAVVWAAENLPSGPHAVMIVRQAGTLPVDCIEFQP